jgi:hypothetical protein
VALGAGYGFNSAGGVINFVNASVLSAQLNGTALELASSGYLGFTTSLSGSGPDTILSRASAGVHSFDTTSRGNALGSWQATNGTLSANLTLSTVSSGLVFKGGSNARIGTGTLVGGTLAVADTSVTANSYIFVQDTGGGVVANIGAIYLASQTAGTGFTVTSSNALDTSTFKYWIFESN